MQNSKSKQTVAEKAVQKKNIRKQLYLKIVNMYNAGYAITDIWKLSGLKSRVTIYRILKRYTDFGGKPY